MRSIIKSRFVVASVCLLGLSGCLLIALDALNPNWFQVIVIKFGIAPTVSLLILSWLLPYYVFTIQSSMMKQQTTKQENDKTLHSQSPFISIKQASALHSSKDVACLLMQKDRVENGFFTDNWEDSEIRIW